MTPINKLSKKERKAYYAKQRGSWGNVKPYTTRMTDKTKYNRKKKGQFDYE
jgi:hypothetical protein